MSDNTKLKKAIRARQERTGESYSTARMHVLASLSAEAPPPAVTAVPSTLHRIQAVLEAHPDLSYRGFWRYPRPTEREEFAQSRAHLLTDDGVQQVEKCLRYLLPVRRTRSAKPKEGRVTPGSYTMKHEVEGWLRAEGHKEREQYIGNGAFIVAAIIAGFPIHRDQLSSPNCAIGIEYEDVRALRERKDPREWRKTTAFVKWLFEQAGRGDGVGMLGEDCKADFKFPRRGNVAAIRAYLSRYGDHVQEWFAAARTEYRALA